MSFINFLNKYVPLKDNVFKNAESREIALSLSDDEETRKLWNYNFKLIYVIKLSMNSLTTTFNVQNTG